MLEFLGEQEKKAAEADRIARKITEDQQRKEIPEKLKPIVEELRKIMGYSKG